MAEHTIDMLELEIESNANDAGKAIDKLAKYLMNLQKSVRGLESIKSGFKISMRELKESMGGFQGVENLEKGITQIQRLSRLKIGNMDTVSSGIKNMSTALHSMNGINIPNINVSGMESALKVLKKISSSGVDFGKVNNTTMAFQSLSELSSVTIPQFDDKSVKSLISAVQGISNVDTKKIPEVSNGIRTISNSMQILGSMNMKETGINNTINALNRLMKVDMKNFKASGFTKVTNAIGTLGKVPDISNSVNRLVSSLARLANAGAKTGQASSSIGELGRQLKKTVKNFTGMGDISASVNSFVQSIAKLANAGGKTGQTAAGLKELGNAVKEFFNQMKTAPKIGENTLRMTEALAKLASAGGQIKKSTNTASDAFNSLSKAGGKAASSIVSAMKKILSSTKGALTKLSQFTTKAASAITNSAKGIASAFSRVSSASSGLKGASLNLGTLVKAAVGMKAASGIVNFGKSAIQLGSDITEVENVVDTAFGSMADSAYKFAETATEKFGLSELAAKQYSGTMMAMLNSSGVAQKQAAKMATTLAGLAGDIASFYNIDTDTAFYKLRAGISGETEPLKQLGINMNIVNLEAFAMSKGINKSYREMSLAEQQILRYNYILSVTKQQQGDFARTAGTWANQMRLLRLNLQSISAIIGQGLIAALLPAIKLLNKFMEKLMQAAKVFRDFMYVLTGKKLEGSTKGVVNDFASEDVDLSGISNDSEDLEENMEDAADGMDDATSSAKKLKKSLSVLPIDELNQLAGAMEDLSTSSGGAGTGTGLADKALGLDDAGLGDMSGAFDDLYEKADITPINKWASKIRKAFLDHDWEGLGKVIADMVNIGLRKIYTGITSITPKVEKALKDFAKVFNSFVKYLDWDLLGRTIGAGINLLTRSFNALTDPSTGINFVELGRKLSVGFRGLVNEIDWQGLGNAFGNYFMIAWRLFEGFVDDMWRVSDLTGLNGWQELGRSLGEGVNGLFEKIDFGSIGKSLSSTFNGVFLSLKNFTQTVEWGDIADNISNGLTNAIEGIHPVEAAVSLGMFVTDLLGAMLQVAEQTPWYTLGEKIGDFLINIPWRTIIDQVFGIIENVFGGLISGLGGKILGQLPEIGNALVVGINIAFGKLNDFAKSFQWDEVAKNISDGLNAMIHGVDWKKNGEILGNFVKQLLDTLLQVAQDTDWEAFGRGIGDFLSSIDWGGIFNRVFEIVKESIGGIISGFAETTAGKVAFGLLTSFGLMKLSGLGLSVGNLISKELTGQSLITQIFTAITGEGGIISKVGGFLTTGFSGIFGEGGLLSAVTTGAMNLVSNIGSILGTIGSVIFSPTGLLIGGIIAGVALIIMNWDSVSEVLGNLWNNVLVPLGEFVANVFSHVWSDILSPALSYLANTVLPILSETIGNLWNNILVPLASFLASTLGPVFSTLGKVIGELWKNVLVPVAQFVGTLFAGAFEVLAAIFNNVIIPVVGTVAKVFQFLGENVLKPLIAFVGGTFANTMSSKFKAIGDIVKSLRKVFKGLIDFITGVFAGDWKKAWKGIKDAFKGAWDGLAGIVKKPINAIIGFLNKLIQGAATAVNSIADMFNNINIDIPEIFGGGSWSPNIPKWNPGKIPYLATGGLITAPTLAVTGERYRKEAVLPLENPRTMSMIASSIMAEAPTAGVDTKALEDAVTRGVVTAMMNNPQAQTSPEYIQNSIYLDGGVLARVLSKAQREIDYRMNPTPQFG